MYSSILVPFFSFLCLINAHAQCLSGNCSNGYSKFRFQNGAIYEGQMTAGKLNGIGILRYANGDQYQGHWVMNTREGKGAILTNNGILYEGNFEDNQLQGLVKVRDAKGGMFEGQWESGKPIGEGTYTDDDGTQQKGKWVNNKFQLQTILLTPVIADEVVDNYRVPGVNIYALIVGASRYDHFESLKYTDDDAYRIYAFLRSPEGGAVPEKHIRLLIDESAIADNIYKSMDEIISMAGPEDVVLIYLAGHGLQGFYVPTDSDGYRNRVTYEDIKERMANCQAHQKLVITDACYSGSLLAAKSPQFESVDLFYKKLAESGGGTAFLLSSKSEEYSLESQGLHQGIFSHYLIRGLSGEADKNRDNMVTLNELYSFVYEKVRAYTGNLQSPVLAGDVDRNMPLASVRP